MVVQQIEYTMLGPVLLELFITRSAGGVLDCQFTSNSAPLLPLLLFPRYSGTITKRTATTNGSVGLLKCHHFTQDALEATSERNNKR
uniref:Putative secreted protein n=1 Tax=Anopheles triannulatus TaxID=58253 RepID=A0A2M4B6J8_9DIPT